MTWSSASAHRLFHVIWSSASAQGIYWDLNFHSFASAYRIVCDLELWNGTVPLPYKGFDFKSRSSASAQRIFCDLKFHSFASAQGIYYVSKFSSSAFAHRTICDLKFHNFAQYIVTWISAVPLPQEKTSFEIPHFCFCTRTLLFFGKSTLIQPPTQFLIFVLSYMNDGPSEGQTNKGIGMLLT